MRRSCGTTVQRRLRAAGSAVALAAAVCACTPTALEREGVARLPAPEPTFEIAGRLSARHGTDAFAGNFQWRHAGERDELALVSPTGQTVALLSGDERGVQLQSSDGRIEKASGWAALTEQGLGWRLPVDGLAFWIQGAPRTGAPFAVESGEGGRAAVLRQDGWTIVYQAYAPDADANPRPTRLTLSYPDVELRLAVDSWR